MQSAKEVAKKAQNWVLEEFGRQRENAANHSKSKENQTKTNQKPKCLQRFKMEQKLTSQSDSRMPLQI